MTARRTGAAPAGPRCLLRAGLIAGLAVLGAAAVAHAIWAVELSALLPWLPGCVVRGVTGLPCPGCGMTRALLLLAQLRVFEAIAVHPAAPFAVAAAAWVAVGGPVPTGRAHTLTCGVALCALLGLWIARLAVS